MQTRNIILFFIASLAVVSLSFSVWNFYHSPKIAYVDNDKLLSDYQGFKQSQSEYQQKVQQLQGNLDTLSKDFQREYNVYVQEQKSYTDKEKQLKEALLDQKKKELYNYKRTLENKMKEEEQRINLALINQVNSFVLDYGKIHDYDYILGITSAGSIMYAKDHRDITKEVLTAINKKYQGE